MNYFRIAYYTKLFVCLGVVVTLFLLGSLSFGTVGNAQDLAIEQPPPTDGLENAQTHQIDGGSFASAGDQANKANAKQGYAPNDILITYHSQNSQPFAKQLVK